MFILLFPPRAVRKWKQRLDIRPTGKTEQSLEEPKMSRHQGDQVPKNNNKADNYEGDDR